jgi:hypothetical protein
MFRRFPFSARERDLDVRPVQSTTWSENERFERSGVMQLSHFSQGKVAQPQGMRAVERK